MRMGDGWRFFISPHLLSAPSDVPLRFFFGHAVVVRDFVIPFYVITCRPVVGVLWSRIDGFRNYCVACSSLGYALRW